MRAHGATNGKIERALRQAFAALGQEYVSASTLENYCTRARKKVVEWSGVEAKEVRDRIAVLLQFLFRMPMPTGEKLFVCDRLMDLYGLWAPRRVEIDPPVEQIDIVEIPPPGTLLPIEDEQRPQKRRQPVKSAGRPAMTA